MPESAEEFTKRVSVKIEGDEVSFLKYLIDCCENVLENEKILRTFGTFSPPVMQLMKFRAEVTQRLEMVYGIKYGKFATRTHLLAHRRDLMK